MGKSAQVSGYLYYLGLHFGLSHGPVDEFQEIRAGDRTAWEGSQTSSGTIVINAPNLFGGPQKEGGIVGNFDVMMGEATQGVNAYLSRVQGPPQPGYRGLLTGVFNGSGLAGSSPQGSRPAARSALTIHTRRRGASVSTARCRAGAAERPGIPRRARSRSRTAASA